MKVGRGPKVIEIAEAAGRVLDPPHLRVQASAYGVRDPAFGIRGQVGNQCLSIFAFSIIGLRRLRVANRTTI
jgi:hypothetical protein